MFDEAPGCVGEGDRLLKHVVIQFLDGEDSACSSAMIRNQSEKKCNADEDDVDLSRNNWNINKKFFDMVIQVPCFII
jgi:hypothetical protein